MNDLATLILRIALGGLMLPHGYSKLVKLFSSPFTEIHFPDPLTVGPGISLILTIFAEFICAIFILIGFRSRLASLPLIMTMAIAAIIVHAGDPLADREMALLYLAGFIAIALLGGGNYSVDAMLKKR